MWHNLFRLFRKPSAILLAQQELEEAQRSVLEAQTGRDYAQRMVDYHQDRIARLADYLRGQT